MNRNVRLVCLASLLAVAAACATWSSSLPPPTSAVPHSRDVHAAFNEMRGARVKAGISLLTDNTAAWALRWQLLTGAKKRIDLSTFIFDDDVFGFAVLGALAERARAGVDVRLLIDGRGSIALSTPLFGRDFLQELVETGHVDVHVYNPPFSEAVGTLIKLNAVQLSASSHNKLIAVDGDVAIVGGRNVNSHYFASFDEDKGAVADADVVIDGHRAVAAVVDVMDREFSSWRRDDVTADAVNVRPHIDELLLSAAAMDAWMRGAIDAGVSDEEAADALVAAAVEHLGHEPDGLARSRTRTRALALVHFKSIRGSLATKLPAAKRDEVEIRVVATLSRARDVTSNAATDGLLRAISGAKRRIVLQTPSFILNQQLVRAFEEASARGVDIVVLTNGPLSSDSQISQALFIDSWPELMARIPRLRLFAARGRQMQHGKRALFDDDLAFVGTYNLDPFSTKLNSETIIATWSKDLVTRIGAELSTTQAQMDEYTIARAPDGSAQRHPADHPEHGQVIVVVGPRNQADDATISALEQVKGQFFLVQGLWDFDVVVW